MTVTFIKKPARKVPGLPQKAAPSAGKAATHAGLPNEQGKTPTLQNDLLPTLKFETVPLKDLKSARHPVRKVSNRQVARVARSIERYGFRDPVLLGTDRELIDGQTRVEAARRLGLSEIPCIIAPDLSEDEIRVLRIAKNRIQERGEWDEQALQLEFAYMLQFEPDLTVTGFEAPEIDRIILLDETGAGQPDPLDQVNALPSADAAAVTLPNDLWRLGSHRILCGNARSAKDLALARGGAEISAVFTDHPFNVPVAGHIKVRSGKFAEFAEASGEMSEPEYEDFLRITTGNMADAVKPGAILYFCIDWRHLEVLMRVVRTLGLQLINLCVWGKEKPGMGSLYRSQHELVLVAKKPGAAHLNNVQLGMNGRNRSNLWRYAGATGGQKSADDDFSLHPTVKPVRMVRDAILDVTAMGDVVLDPFLGSGTTVLAAELSRRICVGIEISPAYVDVAIHRWETMTGLDAVHAATGRTFAEIRAARDPEGKTGDDRNGPSTTAQDAEDF